MTSGSASRLCLPLTSVSENNLQCKLNFPHRHLGILIDRPEAVDGTRVQGIKVVRRTLVVSTVQDIEELRAELDIEVLAEFGDVVVLHNGYVDVEQPRPDDGVPGQVAQKIGAGQWVQPQGRRRPFWIARSKGALVAIGIPEGLIGSDRVDEAFWSQILKVARLDDVLGRAARSQGKNVHRLG